MNKSLQVIISLEFLGIDDPNGEAADEILEMLSRMCEPLADKTGAAAVWIDDAFIVSGGQEVAS